MQKWTGSNVINIEPEKGMSDCMTLVIPLSNQIQTARII